MNYSNLYIDEKFKEKILLFYWQSFPPKYPKILNFHSPFKKKKKEIIQNILKPLKTFPHSTKKEKDETKLRSNNNPLKSRSWNANSHSLHRNQASRLSRNSSTPSNSFALIGHNISRIIMDARTWTHATINGKSVRVVLANPRPISRYTP